MAKFKTLKIKDKKFVFTSYDNAEADNPAYVKFDHFPQSDEAFYIGERKNLYALFTDAKFDGEEDKKKLIDAVLNQFLENMKNGRIDYEAFLRECVTEFGDFEAGDKRVRAVDDFLKLPETAVRKITAELYEYAKREDEFSMGESKP